MLMGTETALILRGSRAEGNRLSLDIEEMDCVDESWFKAGNYTLKQSFVPRNQALKYNVRVTES
jgi:hypothetical protein